MHCGADTRGAPYDVAQAIGQLDATVICLQEDWIPAGEQDPGRPDPVARAAQDLGVTMHRAPMAATLFSPPAGSRADAGPGHLNVSVLTALPVAGYEVIALGRGPGDNVPRVAQVLTFRLPGGGVLRLVNTHLTFSVTSPLQFWQLCRRLKPHRLPTVIAGDLNMPALVARRFPGLTSVVNGPTYPAEQPVLQLDHVLLSRGIHADRGCVLPPAGSDHRPVRASFRLDGHGSRRQRADT